MGKVGIVNDLCFSRAGVETLPGINGDNLGNTGKGISVGKSYTTFPTKNALLMENK